jgi:hypothetical protein
MSSVPTTTKQVELTQILKRLILPAFVLVLLFAVANLATVAKNGQYYPKTHPARQKMNDGYAPPVVSRRQTEEPVARLVLPQRAVRSTDLEVLAVPLVETVGVTVSMQHRSPPEFTA